MDTFSTKHPLLFGAILFFVSLLVAGLLMGVIGAFGFPSDLGTVVGRVGVAVVLVAVFGSCFHWERSFSGLRLALPVLVVVVWNVVYHLMAGSEFVAASALPGAVLLGLAPGFFEEVLFRGIVIDRLRASGKSDWYTLWASALLFALVHLTNAVGMSLANVLVQVGYSLVIGLLLGAIYLKSGDIATVILSHAVIDISNQVFATQPTQSDAPMIVAFAVVLVIEAAYALWLARRNEQKA